MTTYAAGLRVSEVCALQVGDIESAADRMCLKKRQFDTRTAARDFAIRGQKKYDNAPMTAYKCAICGKWAP